MVKDLRNTNYRNLELSNFKIGVFSGFIAGLLLILFQSLGDWALKQPTPTVSLFYVIFIFLLGTSIFLLASLLYIKEKEQSKKIYFYSVLAFVFAFIFLVLGIYFRIIS